MKPLQRLVDSTVFTTLVIAVILANAVVLGLQTYAGIEREYGARSTSSTPPSSLSSSSS